MKNNTQPVMPIVEATAVPRYNYRNITNEFQKELEDFAKRLVGEGQLTAVRIATISSEVKDEQLIANCNDKGQLLLDGERRLLAMSIANKKDNRFFHEVRVEFVPVKTFREYLALQMTFNMDRKNTSFTEDGFGFKRYLENGGNKLDLFKVINFPPDVLTKKAKLKYIDERMDLTVLHADLHPFLDNGWIRSFKSKPHQGYLIKRFSEHHQIALAKEYGSVMHPMTDDGILGFFSTYRVEFKDVPFSEDDESLGIKKFGTGACTGCPHLLTVHEKGWNDKVEEGTYCYLSQCFEAKSVLQSKRLMKQLTADKEPFVVLGSMERGYGNDPAQEDLPNGLTKIRYYKLVEPGSCSHVLTGIADGGYETGKIAKGVVHYVCPAASNCVVHHPAKVEKIKERRGERLGKEKMVVEKKATLLTAIEWGGSFLKGDYGKVREELWKAYLFQSFEYFFRMVDSAKQKTFLQLMEISEDNGFSVWGQEKTKESLEKHGMEKCWIALILAHRFHDYDRHWDMIQLWGKKVGIDFKAMLKTNLSTSLEELEARHKKRKEGWKKNEALAEKQIHALYFDLPLFLGIHDWGDHEKLLGLLADEGLGKKACRLVGVSLGKGVDYLPAQVAGKLIGRKAELDSLLPKYKLPKHEAKLVGAYLKALVGSIEEVVPDKYLTREGTVYRFIRKCMAKANEEKSHLTLAEFVCAVVKGRGVTLPLLHKDTAAIAGKVLKAESLTDDCVFSKSKKSYTFLQK